MLPRLTLVEPTANADAILRLTVVRHGLGPASVRVYVDPRTTPGQLLRLADGLVVRRCRGGDR
ncbi:MAG: hypothetical protein RB145_13785 [Armatimonadota bacterium]|nr:hypothetical protein [Armatimonadota bacterium]